MVLDNTEENFSVGSTGKVGLDLNSAFDFVGGFPTWKFLPLEVGFSPNSRPTSQGADKRFLECQSTQLLNCTVTTQSVTRVRFHMLHSWPISALASLGNEGAGKSKKKRGVDFWHFGDISRTF